MQISRGFADYILQPFAVAPPSVCGIIRIWHGNDADLHVFSKCLLKEQPGPACMRVLCHDINSPHGRFMLLNLIPERDGGTVGPVPVHRA